MTDNVPDRTDTRTRRATRTDLIVCGCVTAAVAIIAIGFATPSLRRTAPEAVRDPNTFAEDLRACRFMKGGRATLRDRLDASNPYIAGCLRRRGWAPDGAPTLESVLRD